MASVWDYVGDLIRITKHNEAPRSDYLRHLGGQAITDGPGSDNIPVICTAVHLANLRRMGDEVQEILQLRRVERYLDLPWMDREPGSRNAYSELITEGVECFYASAVYNGESSCADKAHRWLMATLTASALGCLPTAPDYNWTGPYITLCGARCGASRKGPPNDKRWYADWEPRPPWFMEDHPLSNRLGVILGVRPHAFVKDLYDGYKRMFGVNIVASFPRDFKEVISSLVDGNWEDAATFYLSAIPGPRIPFTFIRSESGAATIAHRSISIGSTSMMYVLCAWNHAPSWIGTDLAKRWKLPFLTWLFLDDPRFRQQPTEGRHATVSLEGDDGELWARGKREDQMAYHEMTKSMKRFAGGKLVEIPYSNPSWRVVWNSENAENVLGDDGNGPPPPPPGGTGWHTVETDNAYLKFTDAVAAAALYVINTGSNHFPVSEVALPPAELVALRRQLTTIVGGQ